MRTILIIPELKYDRNFYNAVRTAEAFGVTEICTSNRHKLGDIFPNGARKAWKQIKILRFQTDEEVYDYLIKERVKILCIENSKDAYILTKYNFPANVALIMGHELLGVPEYYMERFKSIKIPQFGNMGCLNTYVAMSIVLYERFKQKLKI